jgi:hypothetical protein
MSRGVGHCLAKKGRKLTSDIVRTEASYRAALAGKWIRDGDGSDLTRS